MKLAALALSLSLSAGAHAMPPIAAPSVAPTPPDDVVVTASRVDAVTIFRGRALVVRRADASVSRERVGDTLRLAIEGLPVALDEASVQARCGGGARPSVVGIALEAPKGPEAGPAPDTKLFDDEESALGEKLREHGDAYDAINERRAFMQRLRDTYVNRAAREESDVDLRDWAAAQKHLAESLETLRQDKLALDREKRRIELRVAEIRRLRAEVLEKAKPKGVVARTAAVEVKAKRAGGITCFVRYMTSGASWGSAYDAHLDDGALRLLHYGVITNGSGEDWTRARISVSTVDPGALLAVPSLAPHVLAVYTPPVAYGLARGPWHRPMPAAKSMVDDRAAAVAEAAPLPPPTPEVARVVERLQHVVFTSPSRATIPSGGPARRIALAEHGYEPALTYVAVPRVSSAAYLTAKLKHGGTSPLLPGSVRLFLGDDYVGESSVGHVVPGDELSFSFGRDDRVQVVRQRTGHAREERGVFKKEVEVRETWQVEVKSMVPKTIRVAVLDTIPVATDARIHVELDGGSTPRAAAEKSDAAGTLRWNVEVERGSTERIAYGWLARHAKGLTIVGL